MKRVAGGILKPVEVAVEKCQPRAGNRNLDDDGRLHELADSIRTVGLLHPIHVRVIADGQYEIMAGVRRWLAHRAIGAEFVPAVVHTECDEAQADAIRFVENEQRREPTALDTARSLRGIKNQHDYSHEEVAKATGVELSRVKKYLALFSASDTLLGAIESQNFSMNLALSLMRYEKSHGEAHLRKLLPRVVAGELTTGDVEVLRKRQRAEAPRKDKPREKRPAAPRWESWVKRVEKLASEDPAAARLIAAAVIERMQPLVAEAAG